MIKQLIYLTMTLLILPTPFASSQTPLQQLWGTWKLVSITRESASGKQIDSYGKNSVGYISYASDGRMMTILVKENRKAPSNKIPTSDEALGLLNSMTSYAGTYTVNGNQITHHIDVSWNESWTGTDQKRFYKFTGKYLLLSMPTFIDSIDGLTRIVLKWEKVK